MDIKELNQIRKYQGLTYTDLSEKSGVPRRTIENLFGGKTTYPRNETIDAIENALGIKKEQKETPPAQLTDGEVALLEKFSRIPQEQRALFFDMLEVFLKNQK